MNRQPLVYFVKLLPLILFLTGCRIAPVATPTTAPVAIPTSTAVIAPPTRSLILPTLTSSIVPMIGVDGLGDSLYPSFGNGGYDVQHYTLSILIRDVHTSEMKAQTTLEALATQSLRRFNLDFIGFSVDGITVNAITASFKRKGQELMITPAKPLEAGKLFVVKVSYHGSPTSSNSVATDGGVGWIHFNGGSYVLSEPDGAATYFPVNDHPFDKASYTFRVTVPKPFVVAANGILTQTINGETTRTFVWEEQHPMASYLAMIDIGRFVVETKKAAANSVPIRNYFESGLGSSVRKPFARQAEMLAFYSEIFGPYPFEAYGALVLNTEVGTALENQTLSTFGVDQLDLEDSQSDEELVAHEMAHQWFGDSLSVADWSDIWLNEGFATYAQGLWVEHTQGRAALDAWVKDEYSYTLQAGTDMVASGKPQADDLFNEGVYDRAGLILHALRLQVGDKAFFKILQTYTARFKDGNVRTSDFIAVAEEISGENLDSFFDDWLYKQKLPPIPALGLGK